MLLVLITNESPGTRQRVEFSKLIKESTKYCFNVSVNVVTVDQVSHTLESNITVFTSSNVGKEVFMKVNNIKV